MKRLRKTRIERTTAKSLPANIARTYAVGQKKTKNLDEAEIKQSQTVGFVTLFVLCVHVVIAREQRMDDGD